MPIPHPFLDAEALRHLVTRPELALTLWEQPFRTLLTDSLSSVHGSRSEDAITLISKQVLVTSLEAILAKFKGALQDPELTPAEAHYVEQFVRLSASLGLHSDVFDPPIQLCLLSALLHSAIAALFDPGSILKEHYRSVIDLIRNLFPTHDPAVVALRKSGIARIKEITLLLTKSSGSLDVPRRSALAKSIQFYRQSPSNFVHDSIKEQIKRVTDTLPSLWIYETHRNQRKPPSDSRARQSKSVLISGDGIATQKVNVPDFFSDAEGSQIREADADQADADDSQVQGDAQASQEHPVAEKPRLRSSSRHRHGGTPERLPRFLDTENEDAEPNENDEEDTRVNGHPAEPGSPQMRTRSGQRRSLGDKGKPTSQDTRQDSRSSRGLRKRTVLLGSYRESSGDDGSAEESVLQRMNSQDFAGTEDEGKAYEAVVRHAKRKQPSVKPSQKRASPIRYDGHRTKKFQRVCKAPSNSVLAGDEGDHGSGDDDGNDSKIDEERSKLSGAGGKALRELCELTKSLGRSVQDPLSGARKDAKQAKRRSRNSMGRSLNYEPGATARAASPIPESDPVMPRKSKNYCALTERSSSSHSGGREKVTYKGRAVHSGRFAAFEDDLLLEGLRKHGYGAWNAIARDFGAENICRTPTSLKDRARTIGVQPSKFPVSITGPRTGRPPKVLMLQQHEDPEADEDEIEE